MLNAGLPLAADAPAAQTTRSARSEQQPQRLRALPRARPLWL